MPANLCPRTLDTDLLLQVLVAFKEGDFSARLPVTWDGASGMIAETLNEAIAIAQHQSQELLRIGRVVGKEGRTQERLAPAGARGGWAKSSRCVNELIDDLLHLNREIARVIIAVAEGDLSQTVPTKVDGRTLQGEFAQTARTANSMLRQLSSFSSEVTRVAREVGTEGKLGGQAEVSGVSGVWRDLTDKVNSMASNLTDQVRNIAEVTTAVANGDLSKKVSVDVQGEILELKNTINVMVDQLNSFAREVTRVAWEVGTEGKLGGQAEVQGAQGIWKDLTDNVNVVAGQLTEQVRGIARVVTAVANGDLSQRVTVDVQGEILELKNTINVMVDQLNSFAGEVTRVAWEVGTEGKLGGQAEVQAVQGIWKDLTNNVNLMAANLTEQVRGIARVVTAVADGDLKHKLAVEAKGEVAALAETINQMTNTLAIFADQVTTVAREVGVEGRLGGQANVPGATGTWRDLTDNVNHLAATLTTQIRAIAEVTTAVTAGDLTRSIDVRASGEVAVLKDQINQMTRTISRLLDQAEEASRVKSDFLNMAAHELRTPLAVIIGYLSMMADGTLGQPPSNWGRPLELLNLKAAELNKIVQDLLAAARLASGALPEQLEVCDVAQLALDAIGRARAHVELLGAEVQVDVPNEPLVVHADAVQLSRILDNLLNNALTYARGRPWIRLRARQTGGSAVIEVEDHGVGIPEHARELIFERFYRANDPLVPMHPGTGLGLYISRQLAERHNGKLTVAYSEPGQGSTLVLALPLDNSSENPPARQARGVVVMQRTAPPGG